MKFFESNMLPLVSGLIQEVAQWIFNGQPLNTLVKHAPICKKRPAQSQMMTSMVNLDVFLKEGARYLLTWTLGVGGRPLLIGF